MDINLKDGKKRTVNTNSSLDIHMALVEKYSPDKEDESAEFALLLKFYRRASHKEGRESAKDEFTDKSLNL